MMSPLESLPPEVLEQIVAPEYRRARRVSRTLRAASQRELEQHCFDPFSTQELKRYLRRGPMSLAMFL